jgi:hypothetical protein
MFTKEAAKIYEELIEKLLDNGIIDEEKFNKRKSFVSEHPQPAPSLNFSNNIDEVSVDVTLEKDCKSILVQFNTKNIKNKPKNTNNWEFHLTDVDPNPSIPHGHGEGYNSNMKLDPYTGECFFKSKLRKKENRGFIVALWNDQKFCAFAKKAVANYTMTP